MPLREYRAKRDFKITREPKPARKSTKGAPLFVIQKHDASRLHYDFRLELDGVLKSWAVPKGPPFAHEEKRLAMQVEDHPLDYARFEGIIPQGQYGGGTVMVWDIGTWEPLTASPAADLAHGKLHFRLHGKKLQGEWRLVRMHRDDRPNEWLLIRNGESLKPISKKLDDQSVLTGRSMSRIAADHDAEWNSSRPAEAKAPAPKRKRASKPTRTRPPKDLKPRFIEPTKAKLVDHPPPGDWLYELKWDGYRAIGIKDAGNAILLSRNNKDLTEKFPAIAAALASLRCRDAVLDGEIVALDSEGRSSFQLLQDYQLNASRPPLAWYVFDLLSLDGHDLTRLPLTERQKRLATLLKDAPEPIRPSQPLKGRFHQLLAQVRKHGIEGLIGKLPGSKYEPGRRTGAWIKIKVLNEQEFVIGGFTPPGGSRKYFGALLVGYHEGKNLIFASKVGTGYSDAVLRAVHGRMEPLHTEKCPFANLPTKRKGRWGQGITRSEMTKCTWLKPRLVCEVRFTEWTRDGGLRHPAFLGLREDKPAGEVIREIKR
jgi:bifunctional non-homologous end joining protein LigD